MTGRRRLSAPVVLWLCGLAGIFAFDALDSLLDRIGRTFPLLGVWSFLSWVLFIVLSLWGIFAAIRYLLRQLFWTVGRRLFLSYVMIGVMPFFLFAILLAAILYVIAGVASQSNFKAERQASLGELEALNADYALQGRKPRDTAVEVLDSANGGRMPEWLAKTNFSGLVLREEQPLLVASRLYPNGETIRSVVFARPIDLEWARQIEDRSGMIVSPQIASKEREGFSVEKADFSNFKARGLRWNRIFFFEITEQNGMIDWSTGTPNPEKRLFTLISNPFSSLVNFYFGGATNSQLMRILFATIASLAGALLIIYFLASAFAGVLVFSITRAVNRIEKGTKAVERGDFSYRIRMKPNDQLGAMAVSFDRMTESIGQLVNTVAEKERLQSEIEIAAEIQRNLLPKEGPRFRGVSFSAHFEPTASIGGDYYDVFNLDKTRLAVAIGDVSGHGLSTGLVMAMVKAAITTLIEEGADETSLFQRLNELVFRSTERRAFMTLAFTIFDLETGTIRHTNAGHLYPYLLRKGAGAPLSIEAPSLPLGVRSQLSTRTVEVQLQEGDTIVYLSDGIVEAQDENGDPLGFDALESLLGTQVDRSPTAVRDGILEAVARHGGTRPADDDRTIMVLRFDNLISVQEVLPVAAEPVSVPAQEA